MPDTEENPITYDLASEEVIEGDNVGQKAEKEAIAKA